MKVLVTGGSRGIGQAMVKALRAAGHVVAVASRTEAGECDAFFQVDLSKVYERFRLISNVADALGGLDVLVNNAGTQGHAQFTDVAYSQWNYQLELMLTAPFDLSQQAAKYMLAHDGGHIVNVLSTSAFQGARNIAPYVAAKHGLLGLTRTMAVELAPKIRVNAIAPGLTDTDMTHAYITPERRALLESITPAGRFGKPEDIAGALLYLINSEFVYGQTIVVDGGWLAKNG
jgi:NAD(P)-dependent dehydrogenase (short-subunit alcohol dehydrogenase family)